MLLLKRDIQNLKVNKLSLYIFFVLFSSCATVEYRSKGLVPVSLTSKTNHFKDFEIEGKTRFYFWGFYPKVNYVDIDQVVKSYSYNAVSKIKIEEYVSAKDALMSVITFGVYTPRSYRVYGQASH